jgi:HSP20 family protein
MWTDYQRLQRQMDDLFNAMRSPTTPRTPLWGQASLFPLLNVVEKGNAFVVTAEIPGLKLDDVEIKVEGDTLALKGERKPLDLGDKASFHRRERAAGRFQRSLTLPRAIDPDNVKATYKNGVLTITLPVHQAAMPKQISISTD